MFYIIAELESEVAELESEVTVCKSKRLFRITLARLNSGYQRKEEKTNIKAKELVKQKRKHKPKNK